MLVGVDIGTGKPAVGGWDYQRDTRQGRRDGNESVELGGAEQMRAEQLSVDDDAEAGLDRTI